FLACLARLGLPAPYLTHTRALIDGRGPDASWPRELAPGTCRLDLSGDMHHYARYDNQDGDYAAVVSGAGGAFHHPTFTDFGEHEAQAVYPTPSESRRAIADALFHPRTIFNGGVVNISAFLVSMV